MSYSHLFYGSLGVSDSASIAPKISLDATTGNITCNNLIGNINANVNVNLDSINNNINTLFNITTNHSGDLLTLYTTTNDQANTISIHNGIFDNHNDYFNDINAAVLGIDEALMNAQNDILNSQNQINNLSLVDVNLQNQINNLSLVDGNLQNQINGLILTDFNLQGQINTINSTLLNKLNINDLSNYTLINNTVYIQSNGNLQAALNTAAAGSCLKLGSGSYSGPNISIVDKNNFVIECAEAGTGPITELISRGLTISGTLSDRIRISNLTIEGLTTIQGPGPARHQFIGCNIEGGLLITGALTNFLIFRDCSIGSTLQIDNSFSGVVFFINCDMAGCVITLNNVANQQCLFMNCLNFGSYPTKCLFVGLAGLSSGETRIFGNDINLSGTQPLINISGTAGNQIIINETIAAINHSSGVGENSPYLSLYSYSSGAAASLFMGANIPNFAATGGSLYLQNTGDFYTYDGTTWTSQSLGSQVNTKHITVRDNPNSNTVINLDPANLSGVYIQTNGGTEDPHITIDKFNSSSDSIAVLGYSNLSISHVFTTEDQTAPYITFYDSANTALINSNIYFGANIPTHPAGNGSLFIQGGTAPNLYQYNGTAWAGVGGGGGGGGVVGSYSLPVFVKATMSGSQSIPTTTTTIQFNTMDFMDPSGWNSPISGVNYRFTVPYSGIFTINASVNGTFPVSSSFALTVVKNGSTVATRESEYNFSGTMQISINYTDFFNAGDTLQISGQGIGATYTLNSSQSYFTISGYRLDPLTLSSTVYIPKLLKRLIGGTQTLTGTSPNQIFYSNPELKTPNDTWINDSVNGEFTINENGVYEVMAGVQLGSPAGDYISNILIYKNGSEIQRETEFIASGTTNPIITIRGFFNFIIGDVVSIWAFNSIANQVIQNQPASFVVIQKITV